MENKPLPSINHLFKHRGGATVPNKGIEGKLEGPKYNSCATFLLLSTECCKQITILMTLLKVVKAANAAFVTSIPDHPCPHHFLWRWYFLFSSLRPSLCEISQSLREPNVTKPILLTRPQIAYNDYQHIPHKSFIYMFISNLFAHKWAAIGMFYRHIYYWMTAI